MPAKGQIPNPALEAAIATGLRISPQLGAARAFVTDLTHEDDTVIGAFIHGSAARGDYKDESDVDIHIVVEDDPQLPAAFERDGVSLDVVYIPADLITGDPRDLMESDEGREELARGSILWDIVDSIVVFDPDGLVRGYKRIAAVLHRNPELLKLRAHFALEDSVETLEEARAGFADDPLLGWTFVYRATGRMVRPGSAPLAMHVPVLVTARPIGYRTLFPTFRIAVEDLGITEVLPYAEALWGLTDVSVARADFAFEMLTRLFDSSIQAVEMARRDGDPAAAAAAPYISSFERNRALAVAKSLVDEGEVQGAIAYSTGKALQLLSFDEFPNPWLRVDQERPLQALRAGIDKLLGSPSVEETSTRLDALDTLQWTFAELLSGQG